MTIAHLVGGLLRSSLSLRVPRGTQRKLAGRRLGVALATVSLLGLGPLTSSAIMASPASAAADPYYTNVEHVDYCLSSGGQHDTIAKVYICNGSSNQAWHYGGHVLHNGTYFYQIINGDGQCLGISGESRSAGADAVVWACNGHPDQYWANVQYYHLDTIFNNMNSQKVIQIACDCSRNGAAVDQENLSLVLDANQFWEAL